MKYKVIEHLTHVNSVVVEAENEQEAWSKAMEEGLMSQSGKLVDMYVTKFEVEEVSDKLTVKQLARFIRNRNI